MSARRSHRGRRRSWTRREVLRVLAGTAVAGPVAQFLGMPTAHAASKTASRVIFMYFPDGVPGPSQDGQPSKWHPTGTETQFTLPPVLSPLQPWKEHCVFFRGLSMGPTDSGSHPGGAKKLLTGVDGGNGQSVDQFLAGTVGKGSWFKHLYLGVQANHNNASGDKHISYPIAGKTVAPLDDPTAALAMLFQGAKPAGSSSAGPDPQLTADKSVLDVAIADLKELKSALGTTEQIRLGLHLEALREVEKRISTLLTTTPTTQPPLAQCSSPSISTSGFGANQLYDPAKFPLIARAQIDLMVLAMACGLSKVGTLQLSHHTSELIMSRFPGTPMFAPNFDMRSHQASHYGAKHDEAKAEYKHFVMQRQWFVSQLAYLLDELKKRPEGSGTMLDNTLVVLCTEVCDGNLHKHDDMPFVLAGGAGGAIKTGRLLQYGYRRHGDLLCSVAHAMGQKVAGFGQQSQGPLLNLLA